MLNAPSTSRIYPVLGPLRLGGHAAGRRRGLPEHPASGCVDPKDVVAAGNQAIEHGQGMQQLGARMVSHGQAIGDNSWAGDGQHWIADGNTMVMIGERTVKLGQSLANNPIKA